VESKLIEKIIKFELELLKPEVRSSLAALDRLIADDFLEFGASGLSFGKEEVMARLPGEVPPEFTASDFKLRELSSNVVQLVYRATMKKITDDGIRYSLRSSIWKLNNEVWQMEFHQGTPCESF